MTNERNWMVYCGTLLNTSSGGGGLEFFGPFTEAEATTVRATFAKSMMAGRNRHVAGTFMCEAIQLLRVPGYGEKK